MAQTSPADLEVKWLQNNQRTEYNEKKKKVSKDKGRGPPTTTTTIARGKNTWQKLKEEEYRHTWM